MNQDLRSSGNRRRGQPSRKKAWATASELTTRVGGTNSSRYIQLFLEQLDCPRALTVWMLFKYGEHRQLVELECKVSDFDDHNCDFADAYAATKFLSKNVDLKTGIDTDTVAIAAARKAEALNAVSNEQLRAIMQNRTYVPPRLVDPILRAREWISRVLGELSDGMFTESKSGWTPGRTTSVSGAFLNPLTKYEGRLDITRSALDVGLAVVNSSPHWGQAALNAAGPCSVLPSAFNVIRGDTMIVVPKNAKTGRTICYGPHVLSWVQRVVGSHLTARLGRFGINITDQSINRRRARLGSIYGDLATLDLSMASDLMSCGIVEMLLPERWWAFLDTIRSHETLWPDGVWRKNHKFSSMGCGFTFELETLIFWALARSITNGVTVFGDDIILPVESVDAYVELLTFAGFKTNEKKSFASGVFRESCGGDYFRGKDVTPLYHREMVTDVIAAMKFHNGLRRFIKRRKAFSELSLRLLRLIRHSLPGPCGPEGDGNVEYGDGHYHVDFDEPHGCERNRGGWDGWDYETYVSVDPFADRDWYLTGHSFANRHGAAAICAALGPKHVRSVHSVAKRKGSTIGYSLTKAFARSTWPTMY